jgi:ER-bound oxygenase mpaB/B'/Rubber oxygenase, catalytic domain
MKIYNKTAFLFRTAAVQKEINSLKAETDHQRIVYLMTAYEFPFDMTRSLELALFHTYASPSISVLLRRTGEFERRGQKRYDDTSILISQFMQAGYDSNVGERAIAQMNKMHGGFRIPNADFLLVLSTFVTYPIDWMDKYGWRKMSENEQEALFLFFKEVGKRMQLTAIPDTLEDLRAFANDYEMAHFKYTDSNRAVADSTVRIVENWFPKFLRPLVQPTFAALINDKLRTAFGYQKPSAVFCGLIKVNLTIRKFFLRYITFDSYPKTVDNTRYRTYPKNDFTPETIGPEHLRK